MVLIHFLADPLENNGRRLTFVEVPPGVALGRRVAVIQVDKGPNLLFVATCPDP